MIFEKINYALLIKRFRDVKYCCVYYSDNALEKKRLFEYYTALAQDFSLKNNHKYSEINGAMLYVMLNSQSNWWFHFRYSSWIEEGMSDAGTSPVKRGGWGVYK